MNIMENAAKPINLNEADGFDLGSLGIDPQGNITKPGADVDKKSLGAQMGIDLKTGDTTKQASSIGDKKAGVEEDAQTVFKEMFPCTKMLRARLAGADFIQAYMTGQLNKLALRELNEYKSIETYRILEHHKHIFVSKAGNYGVYAGFTLEISGDDAYRLSGTPTFYIGGKTKDDLQDINQLFAQLNIGQNKTKTTDEKKAVHDKRAGTIENRGFAVGDIVYKSRKTSGPLSSADMKVEWQVVKITPAGKVYIKQHNTARNDDMSWPANPANLRKKQS